MLSLEIKRAEISRFGRITVSMSERVHALDSLGHRGREPLLARQIRDEKHVIGRARLIRPVRATKLLYGLVRRPRQLERDMQTLRLVQGLI